MQQRAEFCSNESYESIHFVGLHTNEGQRFEGIDFRNVEFIKCDFSSIEFVRCSFENCTFKQSTLSLMKPTESKFDKVTISHCKLTGIDWTSANKTITFAIHCENSDCSYNVFAGLNLSKSSFKECNFYESDFSEIKAVSVNFTQSNLERAIFRHANLHKADFRFVKNISFDITQNFVKDAIFSQTEAEILLRSVGIVLSDELPPEKEGEV